MLLILCESIHWRRKTQLSIACLYGQKSLLPFSFLPQSSRLNQLNVFPIFSRHNVKCVLSDSILWFDDLWCGLSGVSSIYQKTNHPNTRCGSMATPPYPYHSCHIDLQSRVFESSERPPPVYRHKVFAGWTADLVSHWYRYKLNEQH